MNQLTEQEQKIYDDIFAAYIFATPLVTTVIYSRNRTNTEVANEKKAPVNQFRNEGKPWKPEDHRPGGPNMDVAYTGVCLDLGREPMLFHKPKTDRFYTLLLMDAHGNFVELIGSGGLAGRKEADFALLGPNFQGEIPAGVIPVHIPTNYATGAGRMQIFEGETDLTPLQETFTLKPLRYFGKEYEAPRGQYDPQNDYIPYDKMQKLSLEEFFAVYNEALAMNPLIPEDVETAKGFEKYNIGANKTFRISDFASAALEQALKADVSQWFDDLGKGIQKYDKRNGWNRMPADATLPGSDYYIRARLAHWGMGANPPKAATYLSGFVDKDGDNLNGKQKYIIHFGKDELPPLKEDGYWSVSVYTLGELYLIPNEAGIYKIGSENKLLYNEDGSLDLWIQSEKPEEKWVNNWLPTVTEDDYEIAFRIFVPGDEVVDGRWNPPFIQKNKGSVW